MSWRKITMKFTGTCIECNEKIEANEIGLWAKGLGVKHEKCAEVKELKCGICGASAGCSKCEFSENCDLEIVSPICICKQCSETKNAFIEYQKAAMKNFPILNRLPRNHP